MTETTFHRFAMYAWLATAAAVFVILWFKTAPYGRHARPGWGPTMPERTGWVLMEAVSAVGMGVFFLLGDRWTSPPALAALLLWETHYLYRAFVYPFRRRTTGKRMPVVVVLFGVLFNAGNAYINGRYLFTLSEPRPDDWLLSAPFISGLALFLTGFAINIHADNILLSLRKPGETGYKIPRGGLFQWVSSPNYLGEILEWTGWAVATWSLAGLTFAAWTAANLAPRARDHHRWYQKTFPDYPPERRALIPYVF